MGGVARFIVPLVSILVLTSNVAFADSLVFGPHTYTQTSPAPGQPPLKTTFAIAQPSGLYVLRVGGGDATNAVIRLNGQRVLTFPVLLKRLVTLQDGANELAVQLQSAVGTSLTIEIIKDTTPPTITALATPPANANGWNRKKVTVRFTCADSDSAIAACPAPAIVTAEGASQVIAGTATDKSGNTETASVTLNIDMTAPIVTATSSPPANADGWSNGPVVVTFAATDALSGLAPGSLTAPIALLTDATNRSTIGRATDLAGNVGSIRQSSINIDQRNPRITLTLSPAANGSGFRNAPVTAHFACTDARSGIASCPPDQVITTDGANQTVGGTAVDHAGNSKSVSKSFSIDQTMPAFTITSPADGAVVSASTVTIAGAVTDSLSGITGVTCDGQAIAIQADDTFSCGPLPLVAGVNTFHLVAADAAGNVRDHPVNVTQGCTNLVQDPGFELGVSGFAAQDESSHVAQTDVSPLEGSHSLHLEIDGYGNNLWWDYPFAGGLARRLSVSAHLRSDAPSASLLQFCAMAYYADGSTALNCSAVTGGLGDKDVVRTVLDLDPTEPLEHVHLRMYQEGSSAMQFTLDSASACLDVVSGPPSGGGGGGGGGSGGEGGGGGGGGTPIHYTPGYDYLAHLPAERPFISLNPWTQVNPMSTAFSRFQNAVNQAVAGNPPYAYSAADSVLMYAITGQTQYIYDAINRVEQQVSEAEAAIASGDTPAVSGDSYLDVGWYIEQLALAYDRGYDHLSDTQRQRWAAYAEQAIHNVWNHNQASWGGIAHPWSGWSTSDPGNNYHYSFLKATMLWALATKSTAWFDFLQTQKFGWLVDYYYDLPGGGTREGTGYGTALRNLFEDYIYWKASTGEDLSAMSSHTRETIDYWVHATVPTRDRFAPIGNQSRSSLPWLYDYHENLVQAAVVLSPVSVSDTEQARRGLWWLENNKRDDVSHPGQTVPLDAAHAASFNLKGFLLPSSETPLVPTNLVYHSTGAGVLFARSSWTTDASWLSFVAGKYNQSHAHHDQGSFTLFKQEWLAVTPNIWSHSGLHLEAEAHNGIRFVRNGSTIEQNESTSVQSSLSYTTDGNGWVSVHADLTNAYSHNASAVLNWTRDLVFDGTMLRVRDGCSVASDVQPIFQLQVPIQPVVQPDGSIQAGGLRIVPLHPVNVNVVSLASAEFSQGYRIELTINAGCTFDVELRMP